MKIVDQVLEQCLHLARTNAEPGTVLNTDFSASPLVIDALRFRQLPQQGYKSLVEAAREHAGARPTAKVPRTLILVHPFYTALSHSDLLSNLQTSELESYLRDIRTVLEQRDPKKLRIVAFETAYHYLAATSLLLESGHIDDVCFTHEDRGTLYSYWDWKKADAPERFIAGGYNGRCLQSVGFLLDKRSAPIRAVEGLVLNSPQDDWCLLCRSTVEGLEDQRRVSVAELLN